MPPKDKENKDKNTKRIIDLAGELARAGLPAMFDRFEASDFAAYCLEVAETIYAYEPMDDEEDEDDD